MAQQLNVHMIRSEDGFYHMTTKQYKLKPANEWRYQHRVMIPGFGECNLFQKGGNRIYQPMTPRGSEKLRGLIADRMERDSSIYAENNDFWISAGNNMVEFA